jgi:uncharacterized protein (DUF4415 family)
MKDKDIKLTPEHPELDVRHVVRSIVRRGLKPVPPKASIAKHFDFSKSVKNPYLRKPKKQLTIRLDEDTIDYFRALAEKNGVPYQNLINLYLRDCAQSGRKLSMKWE